MKSIVSKCTDFILESLIIAVCIISKGHILIMSPKCHPEGADVGVDYCWGKSKPAFHLHMNDYMGKISIRQSLNQWTKNTCHWAELIISLARLMTTCICTNKCMKQEKGIQQLQVSLKHYCKSACTQNHTWSQNCLILVMQDGEFMVKEHKLIKTLLILKMDS